MSSTAPQGGGFLNSAAFKMLAGAAAAAVIVLPLAKWVKTQPTFEPTDVGAVVVAALLMMAGVTMLLTTLDRRALARALDPEAGDRASMSGSELGLMRLQGVVVFLAGALLAAPPMLAEGAWPMDYAYAGLAAVFVIQTLLNIAVWRASDGFNRRMSMEASALCFWGLQGALFLWAAAERMGLAPQITAWTGVVILMTVYLFSSFWIGLRRTGR